MDPKLYKAAKEGDVSCLYARFITEEEAFTRIQRTQHGNNNILHIAARAGRDTFVAEALRRFPCLSDQVNSQGDTPLLVAARFGHLQVVKTLAEPNNELPMQDDTATAVESGTNSTSSRRQSDVEEGLVDHQLELGTIQDNVTTLENGTNSSNISRHQRVVEEGLLDDQLEQALHEALRNGHEEVARYLLNLDPEMATSVTGAGESPFFLAVESRCESFMWDILKSERQYSTKGPDGLNVLHVAIARDCPGIHYAIEADYWDLVHEMLKADASIALFPDNDGHTPLLGAVSSGRRYFCRDILKICPESIEARNHEGRHALHLCKFRDVRFLMRIPEILELLNEGDEEGNTPLHLAIKENDYEKAMLLASSASIELGAVNKEVLTALDLCLTDWKNIPQQRFMWLHLATRGAPRGRRPIEYKVHVRKVADYKPLINTMALVATLIATVTFAAAFTMPGGYDTSPDNLGVANLVKIAALKAFIVSDTIALSCSITAVLTLAFSVNGDLELQRSICIMSWVLVGLAMRGTLVAFMCGIFVVIAPKALWVAIFVCIICGIASVAVELSVPILFSPTIIAIIRYRMVAWRKAMRQIEPPGFKIVFRSVMTTKTGQIEQPDFGIVDMTTRS
ncbi:hypothetical protein RHGRI_009711 [Rhododendron griersonianum]|uniref:PGG domain-containing protein n=1 Tax=Rhododendron griersonianum TaxID=479676 RepID=A0AAV6KFU3_9ERIC|nr:hypothetical protein RHGRI_009711 [Rhododendron griersonianum]